MKIEQIVYFVKIARTQSITLAAEQLHISQPAISVSLSDLEAELGVKLFNRSRHGTQLTEQGKRLLGEAEKILQAWENLKTRADIESYSMQDGLCLSAVPSLSFSFMPQLIQRFKDNFPQISIKLFSGGSGQIIKDIASGKSQMGLLTGSKDFVFPINYVAESLFISPMVAIANENFLNQLGNTEVSLKELSSFPLLTFTTEYSTYSILNDKLRMFGKKDSIVAVDSHEMLQQLALQGMGIGFLPEIVAMHSIYVSQKKLWPVRVIDLDIKRYYSIVYLKSLPISKPIRFLLDEIRTLSRNYTSRVE